MSKGEDKICQILKKNQIYFLKEKTFNDLKKGLYRYDFYLTKINGAPALIEYDGEQHFYQVKQFQKTRKEFQKQQEHDRQKNSYALATKIPLYRIPFWEIDNTNELSDIFQSKFLVKSMWHNDKIWAARQLDQKKIQ